MLPSFSFGHEVAIAAIMKDEEPYIREWLDYHIAAGVTKFYIYDNNEEPNKLRRVIAPYVDSGVVEYTFFPGRALQNHAYNDAIRRHRFEARYIALIDGDEFIYPRGGDSDIPDAVEKIMSENPGAAGLALNWRIYGSSGQKGKDFGRGVLTRFTWRANDDNEINQHIKPIVNPRCVDVMISPHYAMYFQGMYAVDEHGHRMNPHHRNPHNTGDRMRINHYITKSAEEYVEKKTRGPVNKLSADPNEYEFEKFDRNEIHDDGIRDYLARRMKIPRTKDEQKKIERLSSLLNLTTALAKDPKRAVEGTPLVDYLAHLFACQKEYRIYLNDETAKGIYDTLMDELATVMMTGQEFWQIQLLFSVLPDMLQKTTTEQRRRIFSVTDRLVPEVIAIYSSRFDGLHAFQFETIVSYLDTIKKLTH